MVILSKVSRLRSNLPVKNVVADAIGDALDLNQAIYALTATHPAVIGPMIVHTHLHEAAEEAVVVVEEEAMVTGEGDATLVVVLVADTVEEEDPDLEIVTTGKETVETDPDLAQTDHVVIGIIEVVETTEIDPKIIVKEEKIHVIEEVTRPSDFNENSKKEQTLIDFLKIQGVYNLFEIFRPDFLSF